jgi:hypothetical protein
MLIANIGLPMIFVELPFLLAAYWGVRLALALARSAASSD